MSKKYEDIIEWKKKFDKKMIKDKDIAEEIAEEGDYHKEAFWSLIMSFETRKLEYVMNGVAVKGLLGTIEKKRYKGRKFKGPHGQSEFVPDRELIKFDFPNRFGDVFKQKEYYDYFLGKDGDFIIYITKDTPKIKSGEVSYLDCMKVISACEWKNHTRIITETEEELEELIEKFLEYISDEIENYLKEAIEINKNSEISKGLREEKSKELNKELKTLQVLKRNYETQRIRFMCE